MKAAELAEAFKRLRELEERECYENSLAEFLKAAWGQFDPATFVPNWHLDAVAEHLEAVANGQIKRLLINVPPRTAKTSLVSICFPAWVWAQQGTGSPLLGPKTSFFYASYSGDLAIEHSVKTRRLLDSRWYRKYWSKRFRLIRDEKSHIENDKGGYRICSSVDAKATGFGGDVLIADDPHLVKEAESALVRDSVRKWWCETMPSRMNDRKTGAMVVVMQRVHEADLSGYILSEELDYVHLCLPMSYDPLRHCATMLGWQDPRTREGQALWPERFPQAELDKLKKELGPYGYAGQYEQAPAPRGGGILRDEWWQVWNDESARENGAKSAAFYPPTEFIVASLDGAFTKNTANDPSALSIWGVWRDRNGNPKVVLMFCWSEYYEFPQLVRRAIDDCRKYKVDRLLIEDKASGYPAYQEIRRLIAGHEFGVSLINPRKGFVGNADKESRVHAVVHMFAEGLVWAPDKSWADQMIHECSVFPRGAHDDLVDSMSQALLYLRRANLMLLPVEQSEIAQEELAFKSATERAPLYDA